MEVIALIEELLVDPVSNIAETIDPLPLVAKVSDSDNPMYFEAMSGMHHDVFKEAMGNEVNSWK